MKCEEAELRMAELLAGEIARAPREALEAHLLDCASCRGDFELARAGARADWPDAPLPPALSQATLALFREEPRVVRFFRFGTAAAAALFVALLVARSGRPAGTPAAATTPEPPRQALAFVQDALVGTLVARDEEGRPVGELGLKSHTVTVEILDGIARTTVEENFQNHTDRRLEGTFHFPLPPDASIFRLALEVNGKIEEGTCLERERAREVFESIVRKMQDPALLEWMPGGIFKCRVFPIEPRATKRVIVAYTQALPFFRGRATYVYPLASEKTRTHPPEEVRIDVRARTSGTLSRIESPSHRVDVRRRDAHEASASFAAANLRPENDFVLSLETSDDELRVVPHKVDGEDGYFALFLTPRGEPARVPAKYVFLLDVSASVSGPELEVARRLVRAMIEKGIPGDRFEVVAHNVDAESSGEVDLRGANTFLDRLRPVGACDLLKALRSAPEGEIIYIGEGTPTFGESDPAKILEGVKGRRIRTVGVGSDANVELLAKLGGHFRVNPNDDVPRRVAEISATLGSPAISDLRVEGGDVVYDLVGVRDVFYGERLVVAGRYRGSGAKLAVTGGGYRRELDVTFPAKQEGSNYLRRLWAQRKVSDLLARGGPKEEIVALGVKHQIMTPYTSFLVLETEQMWKDYQLQREVQKQDEVLGKKKDGGVTDEDPEILAVNRKLDTMKIDLNFENTKLEDILAYVRDFSGLNLVLDAAVQQHVDPDRTFTLKAKNVELKNGLKLLLAQVGLDYTVTSEKVVLLTDPKKARGEPRPGPDDSLGDTIRRLLQEGTDLYKRGKYEDASSRFEEAFQLKPSSDQVYAYIKRAGEDMVAGMMNSPERKVQDLGRRLFELAKPGEPLREGKEVVRKYVDELKSEDHATWRNSFWHLKNFGPHAVRDLIPALGDKENDRYRSRVILLLTELGVDASPAVTQALGSGDPFVRQNAAIVLGNVKDERSLPALARLVENPNEREDVKKFAREALSKIDRRVAPAPREDDLKKLVDQKRELELQFAEARTHFERKEFTRCVEACNKMLSAHPNLTTIAEMRNVAQRMQHMRSSPNALKGYTDEWEHRFRRVELNGIIQTDDLEFPDMETWRELVAKRKPKGIAELDESETPIPNPESVKPVSPTPAPVPSPPPASREYDKYMQEAIVRHQQTLVEVDNAQARGIRHYNRGEYDAAKREFSKVIEYSKWMPTGVELDARRKSAVEMLERTRESQSSRSLDEGKSRLRRVEEEPAKRVERLSDLPGPETGSESLRLGASSNRTFDATGDELGFPDGEVWRELISKRRPKGIAGLHENVDRAVAGFTVTDALSVEPLASTVAVQLDAEDTAKAARLDDVTRRLEESRAKLSELDGRIRAATARGARAEAERLEQDLAQLEEKHVELARNKKHYEERLNHLNQLGYRTDVAPKKPLETKVTATSNELGGMVLGMGRDDGVSEGDEFTVYRGGDFVARVVVDRVDRKWSAAMVVLKKSDPRPGDAVSNHVFVSAPRSSTPPEVETNVLEANDASTEVVLGAGSKAGWTARQGVAITRDAKFVAIVQITEVTDTRAKAAVWRGVAAGRVLPGDKARRVTDVRAYLAGLPEDVRKEIASRAGLETIRAKMGLKE